MKKANSKNTLPKHPMMGYEAEKIEAPPPYQPPSSIHPLYSSLSLSRKQGTSIRSSVLIHNSLLSSASSPSISMSSPTVSPPTSSISAPCSPSSSPSVSPSPSRASSSLPPAPPSRSASTTSFSASSSSVLSSSINSVSITSSNGYSYPSHLKRTPSPILNTPPAPPSNITHTTSFSNMFQNEYNYYVPASYTTTSSSPAVSSNYSSFSSLSSPSLSSSATSSLSPLSTRSLSLSSIPHKGSIASNMINNNSYEENIIVPFSPMQSMSQVQIIYHSSPSSPSSSSSITSLDNNPQQLHVPYQPPSIPPSPLIISRESLYSSTSNNTPRNEAACCFPYCAFINHQ